MDQNLLLVLVGGGLSAIGAAAGGLFRYLRSSNREHHWTRRTEIVCAALKDSADLPAALDAVRPAFDYRIRDLSTRPQDRELPAGNAGTTASPPAPPDPPERLPAPFLARFRRVLHRGGEPSHHPFGDR